MTPSGTWLLKNNYIVLMGNKKKPIMILKLDPVTGNYVNVYKQKSTNKRLKTDNLKVNKKNTLPQKKIKQNFLGVSVYNPTKKNVTKPRVSKKSFVTVKKTNNKKKKFNMLASIGEGDTIIIGKRGISVLHKKKV